MNMKQKFSINKIGKYLREISVVVIGVAITLSASYWLNVKSEKRDMALYLNTIKIELEENMTTIEKSIEYLRTNAEYEKYIRMNDIDSLNDDTLAYYANSCCYYILKFDLKTNAFEMFKTSGVMRLISDKELLMSMWNVYAYIGSLNTTLKWHFDTKWEYMEKDFLFVENGMINFSKLTHSAPMYNFYNLGLSGATLKECKNVLKYIKETVTKLEERK